MQHRDAREPGGHGLAAARIDGVRPAAACVLALVPAVAGGGDREAVERHVHRRGQFAVDLHAPWLSAGTAAHAAQFAADLEQEILEAARAQGLDAVIDCEALGDARQIEREAAGLGQRGRCVIGHVEGELSPTRALACRFKGVRVDGAIVCIGAETPTGDQRADRRIDRAAAVLGPLQRAGHHARELGRQRVPRARRRAVEARDLGVGLPVAHLRDHARECGFDRLAHFGQRPHAGVVEAQRPGRAHGPAGQLVQAGRIGEARHDRVGVAAVPGTAGGERNAQGGARNVARGQGITSSVAA